jgi:Zn-dependent protease
MTADAAPEPAPAAPRPGTLRVARIFGIPVYVTASWGLLAVVLIVGYGPLVGDRHGGPVTYLLGLSIVVMLLLTVLLHELGHAAAARRYRVGVRGITLELLGGFTELDREAPTPRAEAAIALSGPGVSFALAAVAAGILAVIDHHTIGAQLLFQMAATNVLVGVFNVLPGLPLDGGRALRAVVWQITGDPHRAEAVAGWAGRVIAVATFLGGLALWHVTTAIGVLGLAFIVLIAGTLWRGATESIRMAEVKRRLPLVSAGGMARRLHLVATGTPLAEALRQRDESAGASLDAPVVLGISDSLGRVVALVSPRAVAAVPPARRPWINVDEVAKPVAPAQRIAAASSGTEVLAAVQANPESDLLVTVGEDVVGVLRVADVITMLRSREPTV